jgi:hypothetical protein
VKPRDVTEADLEQWGGRLFVMKAPPEAENVKDLTCIYVEEDGSIISPWVLDEDDFTEVVTVSGFTVWLRCWGGMMPTTITLLGNGETNG